MFGALRPDTGSFSRLLVWLGLVCMVAAFVLPWLSFRETSVLRVSEHELRGLTPDARDSILDRQRLARELHQDSWAFLLLLIPGAALVGFGANGLRRQQSVDEKRARAEAEKAEHEADAIVVPQSEDEREEALQAEVIVEVPAAAAAVAAAPHPAVVNEPTLRDSDAGPSSEGLEVIRRRADARRAELRVLEEQILARVAALVPAGYAFQPEVKVSRDSARLLLDGLIRAPHGQPDIIVDVRAARVPQLMRQALDHALANNLRYERITGRESFTWLIMVFDEATPTEIDIRRAGGAGVDLLTDVVQVTAVSSPTEINTVPEFMPPKL